jgi:hypothetical protein
MADPGLPQRLGIAYVRLQHRQRGREGFFPATLSATMANDRKLLVEGESLH